MSWKTKGKNYDSHETPILNPMGSIRILKGNSMEVHIEEEWICIKKIY